MSAPVRVQVRDALKARLTGIRTSAGYRTDAGSNTALARAPFTLEELPGIILLDRDEQGTHDFGSIDQAMTAQVVIALPLAEGQEWSDAANTALADVKQAMLAGDATLSGLTDGIQYLQAAVTYPNAGETAVSVTASFLVRYHEVAGDPYTQAVPATS